MKTSLLNKMMLAFGIPALLFIFSCTNGTVPQDGKAYLRFSDSQLERTVNPTSLTESDITWVTLSFREEGEEAYTELKSWESIALMKQDTAIALEPGTYDLKLELYVTGTSRSSDYTLAQTGTIPKITLVQGVNEIRFETKHIDGTGKISIKINFAYGLTCKSMKAALYEFDEATLGAGEMISGSEKTEWEVSVDEESADLPDEEKTFTYLYELKDVQSGMYWFKFSVNAGAEQDDVPVYELIRVASGAVSEESYTLTDESFNTYYEITYDTDGGTWKENFAPVTKRNQFTTVILPTKEKITKSGKVFAGWYTDDGELVTCIEAGDSRNYKLTAQWALASANGKITIETEEAFISIDKTDKTYPWYNMMKDSLTLIVSDKSGNPFEFADIIPKLFYGGNELETKYYSYDYETGLFSFHDLFVKGLYQLYVMVHIPDGKTQLQEAQLLLLT